MSVDFNHTIVWCRDKEISARFLTELLGLPSAIPFGPMLVVQLDNGVSLDFYQESGDIRMQHYAFLVSEQVFDRALARIREQALPFWADPARQKAGLINRDDGGRGVYFEDPDGHLLELITQPYKLEK